MLHTIQQTLEKLKSAKVTCLGDLMLDRYIYGRVDRISPEAPIPVLQVQHEKSMLGGAANVARNLDSLGSQSSLVGLMGKDDASEMLQVKLQELENNQPFLMREADRPTIIKTRCIGGNQQIIRVDRESTAPIKDPQAIIALTLEALEGSSVLILSDYGKGVLVDEVIQAVVAYCKTKQIRVIVDPKSNDYTRYNGATIITPNLKELSAASQMPVSTDEEVIKAATSIMESAEIDYILATRSDKGMSLISKDGQAQHLPAEAREVYDVSGAGDTVVATLAAAWAAGLELIEAVSLANVAAGVVVRKVGTAAPTPDELLHAVHQGGLVQTDTQVLSWHEAQEMVSLWKEQSLKVGFTNGCFDLLHQGHVTLLRKSREACDRLIVGLNSDASISRLKGADRPVQKEESRSIVLASLASVDAVVVFEEDTPLELIEALKPELLIKGADYSVDQVVGATFVQGYGGQVKLIDLVEGHSTTRLIKRMT